MPPQATAVSRPGALDGSDGEGAGLSKIDQAVAIWGAIGVVFWIVYAIGNGEILAFAIYYPLWLGIVGTIVWRRREALARRLQSWSAPPWVRFVVLGFGAVLAEEIFAALANHLPEGFSLPVLLLRIVQFWALNIFAFFGFVVGWWLLTRYVEFSRREVFYLAGIWGLYAEKIIYTLVPMPAFFFFKAGPTILTYGLIIVPALLSQPMTEGRRRVHRLLKYPGAYLCLLLLSLPAILVLFFLRETWPGAFPPPSMVPR